MKNSKRQIVISQISNSQLSTSDYKHKQNPKQYHKNNPFKNDLNIIQHNHSHLSKQNHSHQHSYLQDQDQEFIQSMKEKEKIIRELQKLKSKTKNHAKSKKIKLLSRKKSPTIQSNKISAKINTINSCDKKATTFTTKQNNHQSIKSKPSKSSIFNSSSVKTVAISKSRNHLLDQPKPRKTEPISQNPTVRKSINSLSNSYMEILAPRKLQYDPDMLMRSPNKNYLPQRKQKEIQVKINEYGLPEYTGNDKILLFVNDNIETKDNSQKIPYRFQF